MAAIDQYHDALARLENDFADIQARGLIVTDDTGKYRPNPAVKQWLADAAELISLRAKVNGIQAT